MNPIAYVTSVRPPANTVTAIDTVTNEIIAEIPVGLRPLEPAIGDTIYGEEVWVANADSNSVSVINAHVNEVIGTMHVGRNPVATAFAKEYAYVTNWEDNNVSVFNTGTKEFIKTICTGRGPDGITALPDGSKLYTANLKDSTLTVIGHTEMDSIKTIRLEMDSYPMLDTSAFIPDVGMRVYAALAKAHQIAVVDPETDTVITYIPVGKGPLNALASPDGTIAVTTNSGSNDLSIFDPKTNQVIYTIPLESSPKDCAFTPDGKKVYITLQEVDQVAIIDTATLQVEGTIQLKQPGPRGIAISRGVSISSFHPYSYRAMQPYCPCGPRY